MNEEETAKIYTYAGTITGEQQKAILAASIAFMQAGTILLQCFPEALTRIFDAIAGHLPQFLNEVTQGKPVSVDRLAKRLIAGVAELQAMSEEVRVDGIRFPEDASAN